MGRGAVNRQGIVREFYIVWRVESAHPDLSYLALRLPYRPIAQPRGTVGCWTWIAKIELQNTAL